MTVSLLFKESRSQYWDPEYSVLTIQGIQDSVLGPGVQCPYYSRNPGLSIGTRSTVSLLFKESRTQYWDPEYSVLTIQGTQDSVLGPRVQCPYYSRNPGLSIGTQSTVSLLSKEPRTQYWDPEYSVLTIQGIQGSVLGPRVQCPYYSRNPGLSIGTRSTVSLLFKESRTQYWDPEYRPKTEQSLVAHDSIIELTFPWQPFPSLEYMYTY